jgi:hypothetical protein
LIIFGTTFVLFDNLKDKDNDGHDCFRILSRKDIIRDTVGLCCTGIFIASDVDTVNSCDIIGLEHKNSTSATDSNFKDSDQWLDNKN